MKPMLLLLISTIISYINDVQKLIKKYIFFKTIGFSKISFYQWCLLITTDVLDLLIQKNRILDIFLTT